MSKGKSVYARIKEAAGNVRAGVGRLIGGQPLREQFETFGLVDTEIDVGDQADRFFRNISDKLFRDLSSLTHERQLQIAYVLYLGYPLAKRGLEIIRNFVVGEGMSYKAVDPEVQKVMDAYWLDPINRWDVKQYDKALEISMYGEQFYPVGVNKENGHVRLGYIDPIHVSRVIPDPENVEIARWVILKNPLSDGRKKLSVIQPDDDPQSATFGRLMGEVFFFPINKVSNATRGNSDLLSAIDWLETHEQFLFGIHEAAILKSSVIWDVLVEGADEKQLQEFQQKYGKIKKGMVRFHNEKVKYGTVQPELGTAELAEHATMLKTHIAVAFGLPMHWLSDPGDANRATAAEMGVPTTKSLRAKQNQFRQLIAHTFEFAIDQAIVHGRLSENVDRRFKVFAPQIWAIDTERIARSILTMAQGLMIAQESGWVEPEEAAGSFKFVVDQLGISSASFRQSTESSGTPRVTESHQRRLIELREAYRKAEEDGRPSETKSAGEEDPIAIEVAPKDGGSGCPPSLGHPVSSAQGNSFPPS